MAILAGWRHGYERDNTRSRREGPRLPCRVGGRLRVAPETVHLVDFAQSVAGAAFPGEDDVANLGKAQLLVNVPAGVALNVTGPPELQDAYVLVHIERSVVDAMDEPPPALILPPGMRRSF